MKMEAEFVGSSNRSGSLTAAILAGGKSRRMKRDKALLQDGQGQTWLSRTIHLAKSRADRVLVLTGSESRYQEICEKEGVDSYPDDTKDCGPLGGIQKALRLTQASYLLCLTCDMPGLTTDHLKELGSPNPSEDIVFFRRDLFPSCDKSVSTTHAAIKSPGTFIPTLGSFVSFKRSSQIGVVRKFTRSQP